nr:sulfatase-like hydrolase/transferase [Paraglaciecola sp. G1-23]
MILSSCHNFPLEQSSANSTKLTAGPQPNIIFFFTDDQAYDTIRAFGNPDAITPNIDKLANQGLVFSRHYNTTSICMASRASVMTGMYEYKHGTNFQHGPMAKSIWQASYPILLKQAGYQVGFAGKFGFPVADMSIHPLNDEEGKLAQDDFVFGQVAQGRPIIKRL